MSQPLFRKEVIEARRFTWLGEISLIQPLSIQTLAAVSFAAAISLILFTTLFSYTQRTRVSGKLVPINGLATVIAPATGVVAQIDVEEGSRITLGQKLGIVNIPKSTIAHGNTITALEKGVKEKKTELDNSQLAQQRLLSLKAESLLSQLQLAKQEADKIAEEISTRKNQVEIYRDIIARMTELQAQHYISTFEVEQQKTSMLGYESEIKSLERQSIATRRTITQIQQAISEIPQQQQSESAKFKGDKATLEQEQIEIESKGDSQILSPIIGVIANQISKTGQSIQAGQPLFTIIPGDGKLEAQLIAPSRAIGFIKEGDKALLRYQSFPYQKFGHQKGVVKKIGSSALSTEELRALGIENLTEPAYRITIALSDQKIIAYGKPQALKPGMLVEADIFGEKRSLIEWLFEPLYSLTGKFAN